MLKVTQKTPAELIARTIASREQFSNAHKTFHGRAYGRNENPSTGGLSPDQTKLVLRQRPVYVIKSYDTPVAWLCPNGHWETLSDSVWFSSTMSHHIKQTNKIINAYWRGR